MKNYSKIGKVQNVWDWCLPTLSTIIKAIMFNLEIMIISFEKYKEQESGTFISTTNSLCKENYKLNVFVSFLILYIYI